MNKRRDEHSVVWSSDGEDACARCGRTEDACACGRAAAHAPGDGVVRVGRETKGRRGKTVTVVRGLALDAAGLAEVARDLKRACGTGGSVRQGIIEIQGDQRERIIRLLQDRGFTVKLAGG